MPWWKSAVVYQIYPRSFADANGDGVGDLEGTRLRLDHLRDLGVDAVWLSPFYRSPMADFGYDVADHCDVDPLFGTLDDFDHLLADAHAAGIRVVVDFVPNHTSDRHPWFEESRAARTGARRDWYVWRPPGPDGGPPNNWRAAFTGDDTWVRDEDNQLRPRFGLPAPEGTDTSAWTLDEATGEYYLHSFLPQQPDLDWRNPEVVAAMHGVLRFWLDRGVDGFRVDAISTLGKPPGLPDATGAFADFPGGGLTDEAFVHEKVSEIRALLDSYDGERMMVGEVGGIDVHTIARHVGDERFHLAFNFPPMYDKWRADRWRRHIDATESIERHDVWPAWVLSNHDTPRHAERYGDEARARAAAVLLLTLRGTAFVYMGEELGLLDAQVTPDRRVDPGGRDGSRAPIPWATAPRHGWDADPWLPFPANATDHDAASEAHDPRSTLALYRRLLAARRTSPALSRGTFEWVSAPDRVLAYRRRAEERSGDAPGRGATPHDPAPHDATVTGAAPHDPAPHDVSPHDASPSSGDRVVIVNTDRSAAHVPLDGAWLVEVSSTGEGHGAPWHGMLAPDQAVVLRPA